MKGCALIYAPRGQAGEYAPLAANPYRDAGHKCAYCYVPQAIKIDRSEFNSGAVERAGFIASWPRMPRNTKRLVSRNRSCWFHHGCLSPRRQLADPRRHQNYSSWLVFGLCVLTAGGT